MELLRYIYLNNLLRPGKMSSFTPDKEICVR